MISLVVSHMLFFAILFVLPNSFFHIVFLSFSFFEIKDVSLGGVSLSVKFFFIICQVQPIVDDVRTRGDDAVKE